MKASGEEVSDTECDAQGGNEERPRAKSEHVQGIGGSCTSLALFDVKFDQQEWPTKFQRNNKRGGLKNLRCFPRCGESHRERGFCGRSVIVTISYKAFTDASKLMCRAEFVPEEGKIGLQLGDQVALKDILSRDRGKHDQIKPYIKGEVISERSTSRECAFEFNRDRKGWHYGWASNKHTCNSLHCLQVYVFEPIDADTFVVRHVARSPSFLLFCRRRRRFKVTPDAPISKPTRPSQQADVSKNRTDVAQNGVHVKIESGTADTRSRTTSKSGGSSGSSSSNSPSFENNSTSSNRNKSDKSNRQDKGNGDISSVGINCNPKRKLSSADKTTPSNKVAKTGTKSHGTKRKKVMDMRRLNIMLRSIADAMSRITGNLELETKAANMSLRQAIFGGTTSVTPEDGTAFKLEASPDCFASPILRRKAIINDLALYLLHEKGFTRSIQSLGLNQAARPGRTKEYRAFVAILERNLEGFLDKHKMTVDEFDKIFDIAATPSSLKEESELTDSGTSTPRGEMAILDGAPGLASFTSSCASSSCSDPDAELLHQDWSSEMPNLFTALGSGGEQLAAALEGWESSWEEDVGSMLPPLVGTDDPLGIFGTGFATDQVSIPRQIDQSKSKRRRKSADKGQGENVYGAFASLMKSKKTEKRLEDIEETKKSRRAGKRVPNHNGRWMQTSQGKDQVLRMRVRCGMPWMLAKMLEFMENEFEITQAGLDINIRFRHKLLSNGAFTNTLDNVERPFSMQLPILTELSSNWKHRAFVCDGSKVHFEISMGLRRITRTNYQEDGDPNTLYTTTALHFFSESEQIWVEVERVQQRAERCQM